MRKAVFSAGHSRSVVLGGAALVGLAAMVSGCGQSEFVQLIETECAAGGDEGENCACIAKTLDEGLPDHLKKAFVALRWPLRPDPADRDAINGEILRSAGIDPADPQAMQSAQREFSDRMQVLNAQSRDQCGGRV